MSTHITYFVHGTTVDNEVGVSSGWFDSPLSELGIKQSIDLAYQTQDRDFDVVFCSDLARAHDSARFAFGGRFKVLVDPRLRECNYGVYNGQLASIVEPQCEHEHIMKQFPGGESMEDVKARIEDFLNFLRKSYHGKNVAIVGHKIPQLSLEILLDGKTWPQAFKEDWRKTKSWQPGWEYFMD